MTHFSGLRNSAVIGGQRLPYIDTGPVGPAGPTVLFLHGWGVSPWGYRGTLDILAGDMRVIAPYLPALTWNRSLSPMQSHRDWAELAARLCDSVGVARAHLVGQSTGGGIAACLAALRPDLTASVTLIDSSGVPALRTQNLARAALVDIGLQLIDVRHLRAQSRLAASFVINVAGAREQLALAACIPLGENLSGDFARITAPSQILWGAQDVLFPATTAHHLHQTMPGSTLHLIDGGFHLWMIDRPKLAAQFVQNFIRLC